MLFAFIHPKSCFCAQKRNHSGTQNGRQTIMRKGFERSYPVNIPYTNYTKLRTQKSLHPAARINDMAGLFVHISVHGHLDVGVSAMA